MGRPERALDPSVGPVEALTAQLRELRRAAGNPGVRELAARTGYSVGTVSEAMGGRRLPSLAVTLGLVRACGGEAVVWQERWRETAGAWAALRPGGPAGGDDEDPPYLGLTGYGVEDADRFFGRDRLVARLVAMLGRHRFLAVFGVSGSGKSSLLRAGVIPALRGRAVSGSANEASGGPVVGLVPVVMTPGSAPREALGRALGVVPADRDVLLVVDQFEELFTMCRDADARTGFIADLAARAEAADGRGRVVVGVRADFYPRCAELPVLAGLLAGANVPVGPLSEDELREVVTKPARLAGLTVERALVTKILADATGQPGALPLVSHALLQTWRQRRGDVLTVAGYDGAGGVAGAVAQSAEKLYGRLEPSQQETVRRLFVRLVTLGEGVQDTRRRADRGELDLPDVDTVLQLLAVQRLVVLDENTVEIAHEALIDAWPRLHGWLHTDRETLRLHRQLTDATTFWHRHDRDPGALYRGVRLAAWDGRTDDSLNALERVFLAESRAQQARERRAKRRRRLMAGSSLAAALVVTSVLAAVAFIQADQARDQRDVALSEQLAADARAQLQVDQEAAVRLAIKAYDVKPTEAAQTVLRQAVADSRVRAIMRTGQAAVSGVAYSPDGHHMASSSADGTVRVWELVKPGRPRGEPRVLREPANAVWSPVFSPDGHRLAACAVDGEVAVWDLATGVAALVVRGEPMDPHLINGRCGVAFSPNGQLLATTSGDGTVRIWNHSGRPTQVVRLGGQPRTVAFSPDGRRLAAGSDTVVWLWDAAGPANLRGLRGHDDVVTAVSFSPDGQRLASTSNDGTVRVWVISGDDPPLVLRGNDGFASSVAFSPDGRRVATGYAISTIRVWNTTSADDPLILRGHTAEAFGVAFSPDGQRLASASGDGTVRLWDAAYAGHPLILRGSEKAVWSVSVSRDGQRIASAGEDGVVRVWRNPPHGEPLVLHGHDGEILQVALSPDGKRVASAGSDRTVRVWDTDGIDAPVVLRGHTAKVDSVAMSPDGHRVASGGGDGTVRIWNSTGHGTPVVLSGHHGPVSYVAFSPDGQRISSGSNDGTVRIWNASGQGVPVVLNPQPPRRVWALAFSPDGQRLASSSGDDGGIRLWQTTNGHEDVEYHGFDTTVESIAFHPDNHQLITAHADGTVRLWHCEACDSIAQVRTRAATRLTTPHSGTPDLFPIPSD